MKDTIFEETEMVSEENGFVSLGKRSFDIVNFDNGLQLDIEGLGLCSARVIDPSGIEDIV